MYHYDCVWYMKQNIVSLDIYYKIYYVQKLFFFFFFLRNKHTEEKMKWVITQRMFKNLIVHILFEKCTTGIILLYHNNKKIS